jgi:hypothetical protein
MADNFVFNTESTTLTLNGTVVSDFVSGDNITLTPEFARTSQIDGSTGTNINDHAQGDKYILLINIRRGTASDVYLNSINNTKPTVILLGSLKEQYTNEAGDTNTESFSLSSGSITTQPTHTRNDQDGNGLVAYSIRCTAIRNI